MEDINKIYDKFSKINPYRENGLGEKCIKKIKDKNLKKATYTIYYFVPWWLSDYGEDKWICNSKLKKHLLPDISPQIYYDLVYLGISDIKDRPRCKFCKEESEFSMVRGYYGYCSNHRYNHIGEINRAHFKGKPLSQRN